MIKAVIYDVDGTMVNSEPLHVAAWDKALQSHGHRLSDLSQEFQATMAGKKPIAIAEGMVSELGLSISSQQLMTAKSKLFLESTKTDLRGMQGVKASVQRCKQAGLLLAIGTSLDRDYVDLVLTRLGLRDVFDVIVTGDQIEHGKPHPETYLTVCDQLRLQPSECVVIEDAQSGIQAAKAAGTWCVAVTDIAAMSQDTTEADVTISSLDDLTLELLSSL